MYIVSILCLHQLVVVLLSTHSVLCAMNASILDKKKVNLWERDIEQFSMNTHISLCGNIHVSCQYYVLVFSSSHLSLTYHLAFTKYSRSTYCVKGVTSSKEIEELEQMRLDASIVLQVIGVNIFRQGRKPSAIRSSESFYCPRSNPQSFNKN